MTSRYKSITSLTLTQYNYDEYKNIVQFMCKLNSLVSCDQPGLTEIPCNLPDNIHEINIVATSLSKITYLPRGLEKLYCQQNKLISLPNNLPVNLQFFNCAHNLLTNLPILNKNLIMLNCSNNPLKHAQIYFPNSLSMLDISYCSIYELPDILPQSLIKLRCNNNNLNKLPEKLPKLLRSLDCSNNNLIELPILPPKLLVLNATFNKLEIFHFTEEHVHKSMQLNNNPSLPKYRFPLTEINNKYNIELTMLTIHAKRMKIMKDELILKSYHICYSPNRIERLIATGEYDITKLNVDL